ncbi:MAG: 50S ribosomal protein L11 [Candidatus Micrarchaeota archaeon]|nr:50S ribosomal protein L11 [Candidatus Micrarchaeota archaeon]
MKVTIPAMIEGGKASAGPPLGPALGPLGMDINKIIATINEKTKAFAGMTVPVKVIIDKKEKSFEVEVGSPPMSALIKKELGIEKGAKTKEDRPGDLSLEQAVKVAKSKSGNMLSKDLKDAVKEVLGTCVSMGVTCGGKSGRDMIREINEGKHDGAFKAKS